MRQSAQREPLLPWRPETTHPPSRATRPRTTTSWKPHCQCAVCACGRLTEAGPRVRPWWPGIGRWVARGVLQAPVHRGCTQVASGQGGHPGRSAPSPPPPPPPPASPPVKDRRRLWLWIGGGLSAILVIGAAVVASGGDDDPTLADDQAAASPTTAEDRRPSLRRNRRPCSGVEARARDRAWASWPPSSSPLWPPPADRAGRRQVDSGGDESGSGCPPGGTPVGGRGCRCRMGSRAIRK